MNDARNQCELTEDDKLYISEVFHERVVPRLNRFQARVGTLNCDFAGKAYKNWILYFRAHGSGYDIVDFEYDEESRTFNLKLPGEP